MELARHHVDFPLQMQRCIRFQVACIRRRLSLSADEVEDLQQEFFLRIWQRFRQSPPQGIAHVPWLMYVLRHLVTNFYRDRFARQRRTPPHVSLYQPLRSPKGDCLLVADTVAAPAEDLEAIDLRLEVEAIVQTLPAEAQDLVANLRRTSPVELADQQGTPMSTLRGRIRRLGRAFARLKSKKS